MPHCPWPTPSDPTPERVAWLRLAQSVSQRLKQRLAARWPGRCAICRQSCAGGLCPDCLAQWAPVRSRCCRCALPLPPSQAQALGSAICGACLSAPPPLERCVAAVDYGWPWQALLARYKFQGRSGWATTLAERLRASPGAAELLTAADAVLPMPLSRERLAERGYHQAWLLARALAPEKADAGLLLRIRHTPSQRGLPRRERLANVRGTFAVEPLRAQALPGRQLLLVDDVMTSGASLYTAAQVLRQAGAAGVSALVFARTGLEPHAGDDFGPLGP